MRNFARLCLLASSMLLAGQAMAASCQSLENMAEKAKISGSYTQWAKYLYQIVDECSQSAVAANNLGTLYLRGTGVSQNTQTALFYFIKSAKEGRKNDFSPSGWGAPETSIGWVHLTGEYPNAPKDLSKAFTWTRRAAEKGHSNGLSNLALMYGAGLGVRKDEAEALELLAKSVEAFSPQLTWLLDKPDDWLKQDFKENLSAKMLKARELYWEGLRGTATRRREAVAAIRLLSSSTASLNSVATQGAPQTAGLMAQISKSTLLECAPEKSAARIEEVFGWPRIYWDNGEAPTALAIELLFPGGSLSPPCSYETYAALLQRGVALGNPHAYELQAISHALGVGFEVDKGEIEYWLYMAQSRGLAKKDSFMARLSDQIADQVKWNEAIYDLFNEHFTLGSRRLVADFKSRATVHHDQAEMVKLARRGDGAARYNLAARAYNARNYDEAMEHLRIARGQYPTAYLEALLLSVPKEGASLEDLLRKRERILELLPDVPEEKKSEVNFLGAKLELAVQPIVSDGLFSSGTILRMVDAAKMGNTSAEFLLRSASQSRSRRGVTASLPGAPFELTSGGSSFYPTSIGFFERVIADLGRETDFSAMNPTSRRIRSYLPSDKERRDRVAVFLMEQMAAAPKKAGLARLLFDLLSSDWSELWVGEKAKEEMAAYKMYLANRAASQEISVDEIREVTGELERYSASDCTDCRGWLAIGLLHLGEADSKRLGNAYRLLDERVNDDGQSQWAETLFALGARLSKILIEELQSVLLSNGYYQGTVDGIFGSGTKGAIDSFAVDANFAQMSPDSFNDAPSIDWLAKAVEEAGEIALATDKSCFGSLSSRSVSKPLCMSLED